MFCFLLELFWKKNGEYRSMRKETRRKETCRLTSGGMSVVDLRGLEPLTFCMPCRRAPSCATGPYELHLSGHPACAEITGLDSVTHACVWRKGEPGTRLATATAHSVNMRTWLKARTIA